MSQKQAAAAGRRAQLDGWAASAPATGGRVGDTRAAAHDTVRRGWSPIPLHHVTPVGTCSCNRGARCGRDTAKHPRETSWQSRPPLRTAGEVEAVWSRWPQANLGLRTGRTFWALDVDPDSGGFASLARLQAEYGPLPDSYRVRTGSGGCHLYLAMPTDPTVKIRNSVGGRGGVAPGIDVRGPGGQVVAPPSVSLKGGYVVEADVPIAPAPGWLLDLVRLRPAPAPPPGSQKVLGAPLDARERAWLLATKDGVLRKLRSCQGMPVGAEPRWEPTTYWAARRLIELSNRAGHVYPRDRAREDLLANAPSDNGFGVDDHQAKWDNAEKNHGTAVTTIPPPKVDVDGWVRGLVAPGHLRGAQAGGRR